MPLSYLALASLLYPTLLEDFLFDTGVKYAASSANDVEFSSISEFSPPKTPAKHTPLSLVAIKTDSLVKSLSTPSRVVSFSPLLHVLRTNNRPIYPHQMRASDIRIQALHSL